MDDAAEAAVDADDEDDEEDETSSFSRPWNRLPNLESRSLLLPLLLLLLDLLLVVLVLGPHEAAAAVAGSLAPAPEVRVSPVVGITLATSMGLPALLSPPKVVLPQPREPAAALRLTGAFQSNLQLEASTQGVSGRWSRLAQCCTGQLISTFPKSSQR